MKIINLIATQYYKINRILSYPILKDDSEELIVKKAKEEFSEIILLLEPNIDKRAMDLCIDNGYYRENLSNTEVHLIWSIVVFPTKNNPDKLFNDLDLEITKINEKYDTKLFENPGIKEHFKHMVKFKDVTLGNNYIGDIAFQRSDLPDGIKETLKQVVDRINKEKKS